MPSDTHLDREHTRGWVNVRSLGAQGDDGVDDWDAFDRALSILSGGGVLLVPAGTYRISKPLLLRSGIRIQGETPTNFIFNIPTRDEKASYIYLAPEAPVDSPLFYSLNKSLYDVEFRDLQLGAFPIPQTAPDTKGHKAIDIEGHITTGDAWQLMFRRCRFYNWATGIVVADSVPGGDWNLSPAAFRNCTFSFNGTGVKVSTANADVWLFDTCEWDMAAADSVGVNFDRSGVMTFLNCAFIGIDLGGGLAANMNGVLFSGAARDVTEFLRCHSEALTNWIAVGAGAAGSTIWPLILDSCTVESDISFAADTHLVSRSNRYGGSTGGGHVFYTTAGTVIESMGDTFIDAGRGFFPSGGGAVPPGVVIPSGGAFGVGVGAPGAATFARGISPGSDAGVVQAGRVFMGSGVPNNANGANGDVYHRTDTPGVANQRLYVKSAGAWLGIL